MGPSSITLFFRRIVREKFVSSIQILSLLLANVAGIFVIMYTMDELSFDQFHTKKERVFRVVSDIYDVNTHESKGNLETNAWPLGATLKEKFPEVEKVVYAQSGAALQVNWENDRIQENVHYVSEDFLDMFSFPLVEGDAKTALKEPYSIVITPDIALKYFPNENPIGKSLLMGDTLNMMVTAVVESPKNSHIQFGILVSFSTYEQLNPSFSYTGKDGWGNFNVRNYIMLKQGVNVSEFEAKAKTAYMSEVGEWYESMGMTVEPNFEPLNTIYLNSTYGNGFGTLGSMERVKLIGAIGLVTLLLACINFINLSTARSTFRAKEIGLRKVSGGTRGSIISQFLFESFLYTFVAFLGGIALVYFLLPFFNLLIGKQYTLAVLMEPNISIALLSTVILISLISGYYPARVLSRFVPSEILKGKFQKGKGGIALRRFLVIFQFVICSGLIIGVLLTSKQINYMKERPLGFEKEQLITLDMRSISNGVVQKSIEAVVNDIKSLSAVTNSSFTAALPGRPGWDGQWATPEGKAEGESVSVNFIPIDDNFVNTMGMELVAGIDFNKNQITDLDDGLLINETAVQIMGWESPENAIGKKIDSPSGFPRGRVIGVIKDFNQKGLQEAIGPMVFDYYTKLSKYLVIKYTAGHTTDVKEQLSTIWNAHFPEHEFNYFFVDEDFEQQYQAEEKVFSVFSMFAFIAIFIAAIGLVGLISFLITSRTREIGIRKVLGAGNFRITRLIVGEFVVLVIIANLFAIPIAWILGNKWLEGFAFSTEMGADIIIISTITTLVLAVLTIGFQALKAGNANPADSLRTE